MIIISVITIGVEVVKISDNKREIIISRAVADKLLLEEIIKQLGTITLKEIIINERPPKIRRKK